MISPIYLNKTFKQKLNNLIMAKKIEKRVKDLYDDKISYKNFKE